MPAPISSLQNNRIKNIVKLHNRRHRDAQQLTPVEGAREIGYALRNGFIPKEAYLCPDLVLSEEATAVAKHLYKLDADGKCSLFTITKEVFSKIAYRGEKDGLLILLNYWQRPLPKLTLSRQPFLVIVEGSEKPGNLGAILRSADAANVDAIIICDPEENRGTDIFNPNTVRASLGAIFTVPVISATTLETIQWLQTKNIQIVAASPEADSLYTAVNLQGPVAIIMGSEATGLSQSWLDIADFNLQIPMLGQIDSLNLSISTALMLYEIVRQRGINGHEG